MKSSFEFEYETVRSSRRTVCIEITKDAKVLVRAPIAASDSVVCDFIKRHEKWIISHLEKAQKRNNIVPTLDKTQIIEAKIRAEQIIAKKVKYYSEVMKLYPTDVKITTAKRRFGSCSAKNSLCFSYMLLFFPDEAVDYVVVHELAHIRYKNHGKQFYALIAKYLPDYRKRIVMLNQ